MKEQKIALTARQFNRLVSTLRDHPHEPVAGEHLSDDEFVYYSLDETTPEEVAKIESHLVSCERCLAEMEQLVETAEAWRGPEAEERFKRKHAEIAKTMSATPRSDHPSADHRGGPQQVILLPEIALYGARTGRAMATLDGQLPGGELGWRIIEDDSRNLIVRFRSYDLSLVGTQLKLSAGIWRRVITLSAVKPDHAGARTVITRKEREELRAATPLRLDFFLGNK